MKYRVVMIVEDPIRKPMPIEEVYIEEYDIVATVTDSEEIYE
jgi:hypothetical protein